MRPPHDTSPEAWSRQLEAIRALSPRERVRLALEMSEEVRSISLAGARQRSSDSARQAGRRLAEPRKRA